VKTLGEIIREAREAKGLTLRALARALGVSAPFLSDIEHDRRRPDRRRLKAFSEALGIDLPSLEKADPRTTDERLKALEHRVAVLWRSRDLRLD
jgi:transcriptional regulator with XRE-family HTH domain